VTDDDPLGWSASLDSLRDVTARLVDGLPPSEDDGRAADLALKMFGTMTGAYLSHLLADPVHPVFLPSAGYHQMYGSPNPDTVYRTAVVEGRGEYLLTGRRGSAPEATIMPFGPPTADGLQTFAPYDLDEVTLDDGTFEVVLGARRPEGSRRPDGSRRWWSLEPDVRTLMLRSVSSEWGLHTDPRIAIVRLDADPRRARIDPDTLARRLRSYAAVVEAMIISGLRRVADLRARGVVNRLEAVDYSASGGLGDQWYHEGWFSLGADEALVMEAQLATGCAAYSLSLTDAFFSMLDWANAQSSLNHRQASLDADERLRVVVAGSDPGVANWLDTTGHRSGVLQCRWLGGDEPPRLSMRTSTVRDLADLLPAGTARVTPRERTEAIRARQIGVQLRSSLW
jgi:hypothetical protein